MTSVSSLKFTLRDLFWLTLLAAFSAAWWIEHERYLKAVDANQWKASGGGVKAVIDRQR
jgi:hypothetical protein